MIFGLWDFIRWQSWWVVLFGGNFSWWFLGQVILAVASIFLFQNGGWFLCGFKINIFWFQNREQHCANRAVMLCRFGAIKIQNKNTGKTKVKIKGVHNKSFKLTALRAAA